MRVDGPWNLGVRVPDFICFCGGCKGVGFRVLRTIQAGFRDLGCSRFGATQVVRPCASQAGRARLGMTLEPLLGFTALYPADVSRNTSTELSQIMGYQRVFGPNFGLGVAPFEQPFGDWGCIKWLQLHGLFEVWGHTGCGRLMGFSAQFSVSGLHRSKVWYRGCTVRAAFL